jgi:hypothetical protein
MSGNTSTTDLSITSQFQNICSLKTKSTRRAEILRSISNKYQLVRLKFIQWSQLSTSHGYPNLFRTDKTIIKYMWSVFLLFFVAASSYFVINNILDYLKFEATSKIRVVSQMELAFPAVSICSSYMFQNNQKSSEFLVDYFRRANVTTENWTSLVNMANLLSIKNLYNELYTLKQFMFNKPPEFKTSFGLNISQFLIFCRLGTVKCNFDNVGKIQFQICSKTCTLISNLKSNLKKI